MPVAAQAAQAFAPLAMLVCSSSACSESRLDVRAQITQVPPPLQQLYGLVQETVLGLRRIHFQVHAQTSRVEFKVHARSFSPIR